MSKLEQPKPKTTPYEQYRNDPQLKKAALRYCEIVGLNPEAELDQNKIWWMIAKDISHHMAITQAISETYIQTHEQQHPPKIDHNP